MTVAAASGTTDHFDSCDGAQCALNECAFCNRITTDLADAPATTDYVEAGEPLCVECLELRECETCRDARWPRYMMDLHRDAGILTCPACRARSYAEHRLYRWPADPACGHCRAPMFLNCQLHGAFCSSSLCNETGYKCPQCVPLGSEADRARRAGRGS